MQLKRGWWKQRNGEYAFLAGEHGYSWFGRNSKETATTWLSDSGRSWYSSDHEEHGCGFDDLTDTYCGDGPEPVEPVQLCLGWWERRDGYTTKIITNHNDGRFRWETSNGLRYDDEGMLWVFSPSKMLASSLVKRRPDLDAKEAAAQQAQPDPRDAEIERLKEIVIDKNKTISRILADNLTQKTMIDSLRNQRDNIKRIIGDH